MTKLIKGVTPHGQQVWVAAPNIAVYSFINDPKRVTFLEIFYFFAQSLFQSKKKLTVEEESKVIAFKKRVLIELNNKVVQLQYFANELKKQEKILLNLKHNKKRIYNYKPHQIFIGLTEAYLNTIYSIKDSMVEIDKFLNKKFSKDIWKKDWFRICADLRNLFQHTESPLVTTSKGKITFTIERINELKSQNFFTNKMRNHKGYIEVNVIRGDMGDDMLKYLNDWAKKYLKLADQNKRMELITGFKKDGGFKSKKVTLKDLLKLARTVA